MLHYQTSLHQRPSRTKSGWKALLGSGAVFALTLAISTASYAQTTIEGDQTSTIRTSTAGDDGGPDDVIVDANSIIDIAGEGPGLVLDSDNTLTHNGSVTIEDQNNATGVELQGGADRSYTQSGTINISETFEQANTDDDAFNDTPFADPDSTGRTGILISGASPFEGNIDLDATSAVVVTGDESFGINLANTPMMMDGLTGSLTTEGQVTVTGENSFGVNVGSGVTGDLVNNGVVRSTGVNSTAYNIGADVQGGFVNSGQLNSNGYRFSSRPPLTQGTVSRNDLTLDEDLGQSGPTLSVSGDVGNGIYLQQRFTDVLDADGNQTFDDDGNVIMALTSISSVAQFGSAPAVLLDGDDRVLAIGMVAPTTDPAADDFDADLLYAFVNDGTIASQGVYDDFDATALSVANAELEGGLSNSGSMTSFTFRSPTELDDMRGTGLARVIVLGDQAIADEINNSGAILARASEAADQIFADQDNPLAPREINAIAIDIGAGATASTLTNTGNISAVLIGREGRAVAIADASGTLTSINNQGTIATLATTSDPTGEAETDFTLIAIDASQNTLGLTITQSQQVDSDPDDDITPATPGILGSILLGSGDDSLISTDGIINGSTLDFGEGNDTLALSGGTTLTADVLNSGGLELSVTEGSSLTLGSGTPLPVTNALIDGTSTFSPVIDGEAGTASTLVASGDITIEDGATISPILNNVVGINDRTFTLASAGGTLEVGDVTGLASGDTPFLYNTDFSFDTVSGDLIVTLDLRDPATSLAEGGLGLDQVQQGAFDASFEALTANPELGNAFANISNSGDFYAAYNQILPEFSAAARQFVVANVDGATGAVGTHLDNARRSPEKPGGAWLQQFAYFADRDLAGLSEQYRGSGFGFTGGLDTAFGPFHTVGVNFGFASTEIEDVVGIDEPFDVVTLQTGLYAGYKTGNLGLDLYAGGGYNEFEQQRRVRINEFFGSASGDWTGTHINASARAGYDIELSEKFWIRPALSVDYLRLSEKAFEETGTSGVTLAVDDRTSEAGSASAMINLGAKFQGKRTWIRPSLRVGYRYEFLNDPVLTSYRFTGLTGADGTIFDSQRANLESVLFPDNGILVGFSLAAGSAYSSIGFDFDSDIRDGFIRHTGRVVIRLLF